MKRLTWALAIQAMLVWVSAEAWSDAPDAGTELDPVDEWLRHARACQKGVFSLKARFTQDLKHPLKPVHEEMTGTVEVRRGWRIRIAYETPKRRLIVSDGNAVWAYDPEAKIAIIDRPKGSVLYHLFKFLIYEKNLDRFSSTHLGGARRPQTGKAAIQFIPKKNDPIVKSVVLTLNATCPPLTRILLEDVTGAVIRVTLDSIRTNVPLGAKRFTFKPPSGTKIIRP